MNRKYIDMVYSENHLEHHGILGQKWGVENGPPYPLGRDVQSMLANGEFKELKYALKMASSVKGSGYTKKDYKADKKQIKEYVKTGMIMGAHNSNKTEDSVSKEPNHKVSNLKKLYKDSKSDYEKECEKIIDEKVSEEDINKCVDLYLDFVFGSEYYDPDDFYESEEFRRANEKAWDETKKYFKEDDPDKYKEMLDYSIKKYGDESGMEDYHDFRKILDGMRDEEWDKGEKEFYKNHPEYKESAEKEARALEKYSSEVKRISGNIFGNKGNEKLKNKYGGTNDTINATLRRKLDDKIVDTSQKRIKSGKI